MTSIKVLLADPDVDQRSVSIRFLQRLHDIRIVGQAKDGLEAYSRARLTHPDVILTELAMKYMNGFDLTRQIKAHSPSIKIVVLTTREELTYRVFADLCGVDAYICKSHMDQELPTILHLIKRRIPRLDTAFSSRGNRLIAVNNDSIRNERNAETRHRIAP